MAASRNLLGFREHLEREPRRNDMLATADSIFAIIIIISRSRNDFHNWQRFQFARLRVFQNADRYLGSGYIRFNKCQSIVAEGGFDGGLKLFRAFHESTSHAGAFFVGLYEHRKAAPLRRDVFQ